VVEVEVVVEVVVVVVVEVDDRGKPTPLCAYAGVEISH